MAEFPAEPNSKYALISEVHLIIQGQISMGFAPIKNKIAYSLPAMTVLLP